MREIIHSAEVGLTDRRRLAQAALRWTLAQAGPTCMVIGAAGPEHLASALAALDDSKRDEDAAGARPEDMRIQRHRLHQIGHVLAIDRGVATKLGQCEVVGFYFQQPKFLKVARKEFCRRFFAIAESRPAIRSRSPLASRGMMSM